MCALLKKKSTVYKRFEWTYLHGNQAHRMSNYLRHLLTKQLDVTTNPPEKRFIPRFFHPILNEGEDKSKKVDIKPHHVERLYGVMMARMLQGNTSIKDMYTTRSWFKHNAPAVDSMLE